MLQQKARIVLFALATLAVATVPAQAGLVKLSSPVPCAEVGLRNVGDVLNVYASLSGAIGIRVTTDQPGEGITAGVLVKASGCTDGTGGVPEVDSAPRLFSVEDSERLLPLP